MSETTLAAVGREDRQRKLDSISMRNLTLEQVALLKNTVCKGATDDEFQLFIAVCGKTGLDPFTRQIHAVFRYDRALDKKVMSIQTGIDGYRLIAQRTHEYEGQLGPWWCGRDGAWCEIWTKEEPPFAAKVGVIRRGFREPVYSTARWLAYMQEKQGGAPNAMWTKMGPEQLAKCAEALALRRSFPNELSSLYTDEEMEQADDAPEQVIERRPQGISAGEKQAKLLASGGAQAAAAALGAAAEDSHKVKLVALVDKIYRGSLKKSERVSKLSIAMSEIRGEQIHYTSENKISEDDAKELYDWYLSKYPNGELPKIEPEPESTEFVVEPGDEVPAPDPTPQPPPVEPAKNPRDVKLALYRTWTGFLQLCQKAEQELAQKFIKEFPGESGVWWFVRTSVLAACEMDVAVSHLVAKGGSLAMDGDVMERLALAIEREIAASQAARKK